jgi:hypothetical protein
MEENKIVKKVIRKPIEPEKTKTVNNNAAFFRILNVAMFIMILIIFFRGFGVKSTVHKEMAATQEQVRLIVNDLNAQMETNRQIDKNEILSTFALYSRLDAESLKEQERYHKEQQAKYENIAKQYNQGLNNLANEIKSEG